jgi:KUP system potassium uptake protein
MPITLAVLTALFLVRIAAPRAWVSTSVRSRLLWFVVIGAIGGASLVKTPAVLKALDPRTPSPSSRSTGGPASSSSAASSSWRPAPKRSTPTSGTSDGASSTGRGSRSRSLRSRSTTSDRGRCLLRDPGAGAHPFFLLVPSAFLVPVLVLATVATCIASQAVITGAFSLTAQAIQLGFLPRLEIRHTSREERGQIYIPQVNWLLFVLTALVVLSFHNSTALAAAYGIAVTSTMVITSVFLFYVLRERMPAACRGGGGGGARSSRSTRRSSAPTCSSSPTAGSSPCSSRSRSSRS